MRAKFEMKILLNSGVTALPLPIVPFAPVPVSPWSVSPLVSVCGLDSGGDTGRLPCQGPWVPGGANRAEK